MRPAFLGNPEVVRWLGGVEPIWTHLEYGSFCRLLRAPSEPDTAIFLAKDLTPADLEACPMAANAVALLRAAARPGGLKLTAAGNLRRVAVAEISRSCLWPGADLNRHLSRIKTPNEQDVWPLYFLRMFAVEVQLLRKRGQALVLTAKGRAALEASGAGDLVAHLFDVAFWRFNLDLLDGYPISHWPQMEIGQTLWCLSVGATLWERPDRLARLATTPVIGILEAEYDYAGPMLENRILVFLSFFGLLESQIEDASVVPWARRRRYRKTRFFDRFLSFDVQVEAPQGPLH